MDPVRALVGYKNKVQSDLQLARLTPGDADDKALLAEMVKLELEIADVLCRLGRGEDAVAHLISQASCLNDLGRGGEAWNALYRAQDLVKRRETSLLLGRAMDALRPESPAEAPPAASEAMPDLESDELPFVILDDLPEDLADEKPKEKEKPKKVRKKRPRKKKSED